MQVLGSRAGIKFDYQVQAQWQPVESQRLMLWAGRFGKQEEFMTALGHRHFEKKESASHRRTLLAAAEEVGLDVQLAQQFLNTDELVEHVWRSYGTTIREKGIHSIPLFVFNGPKTNGGPFRPGPGQAIVHSGSGDPHSFLQIFSKIWRESKM
mmetsp:Transcript_35668/g.42996  ORF Transcript_35668/g.42996 Transcript_35668/m.42996 type:complete len:153 (-) Transcript_35668:496-954(-)